jgi:hypothetical protein
MPRFVPVRAEPPLARIVPAPLSLLVRIEIDPPEPPPRRGVDALRLKDRSQLIIGHDSEHPDYGYGPVFDTFKHRFTLSSVFPWTTVVSDTDPLDWIADALRPLW